MNNKNLGDCYMFILGFVRGAIFGISLGLMSGLIAKKICKKNKVTRSKAARKVI